MGSILSLGLIVVHCSIPEDLFLVIEEVRFGNDCFQFFKALAAFFNERCVIHGVCV